MEQLHSACSRLTLHSIDIKQAGWQWLLTVSCRWTSLSMMTRLACWRTATLASQQGHMLLQASLKLGDLTVPERMHVQCTQTFAAETLATYPCAGMLTCAHLAPMGAPTFSSNCLQATPRKQPMPQMATTCPVMAGQQARCVPASHHCQVAMLTLCQHFHLPGILAYM